MAIKINFQKAYLKFNTCNACIMSKVNVRGIKVRELFYRACFNVDTLDGCWGSMAKNMAKIRLFRLSNSPFFANF